MNSPEPVPIRELEADLRSWRSRTLTLVLSAGLVLIFPALLQTLLRTADYPAERAGAIALLVVYLFTALLAALRKLDYRVRGWGALAVIYTSGLISLGRGGLAGDGRVYLVVLPMVAATLVGLKASRVSAAVSLATYSVFAYLAVSGRLEGWLIVHENPVSADHWVYDGLVMATLMIASMVMLNNFTRLLMRTIRSEQTALRDLQQANLTLEEKVEKRTAELAEANRLLLHQATHDALTGLPNRVLFFDRLEHAIQQAERQQTHLSVLFIDLNNFKDVNDTYGHTQGDHLLQEVARRINTSVRESDTVARLSGDEFTVILENLSAASDVGPIAAKIASSLSQPVDLNGAVIRASASIGASHYPQDGAIVEDLIRHADLNMYQAKAASKFLPPVKPE